MILLPKGTYGASAGGGRGGAANIRLLTSSLDKQLRLWDISADVMSLEVGVSTLYRARGVAA